MQKFPTSPPATGAAPRLLELEVEPLSEQRWAKIEQAVFERLDDPAFGAAANSRPLRTGSRRLAVWLAAAAAFCVVGVALAVAGVFAGGNSSGALSRISTGATASHVALPGLLLDVSPDSAIVVSGSQGESQLIVLDRGAVACDVAHRRPGAPLFVQAGEVRVEVVGTRFHVSRHGEAARVAVQEGVVRVTSRGQTQAVRAGESWPAAPAPSRARPLEPPATPQALPLEEPTSQRPRSGRPAASRAAPLEPESTDQAPPEVVDLQAQFESAARLERSDPGQAIQLYRGLEGGGSPWAKNALFAHGRLEAARGNRAEAKRILTQYLTRFPQGANAEDARMLLSRLD
jgi:hypothetical protein